MKKPAYGTFVVCFDWKSPKEELTYGKVVPPANQHEHKQTATTNCFVVENVGTGVRRITDNTLMMRVPEALENLLEEGKTPPLTKRELARFVGGL